MKKILLVVASNGYQHIEYGTPKRLLQEADFQIVTGSDTAGIATGKDGSTTSVDIVLSQIHAVDYDGIFFIGGSGALEHLDNQESNRILNEAMLSQVPYGAICISVRILAKAHVLVGKKATGWNEDGKLEEILSQNGASFVSVPVVVDGLIVTGSGPEAAEEFGKAIIRVLNAKG